MSQPTVSRAYHDSQEHLRDELRRVDLLLRRHVEAWWAENGEDGRSIGGYFVSDAEVDRLLASAGQTRASSTDEGATEQAPIDATLSRLTTVIRAREQASEVALRLARLTAEFGLSAIDRDALLLALAPDLDRKYEKVYGYLHDDVTSVRPTIGLIRRILAGPESSELALSGLFDEHSTLRTAALVEVIDGPTIPGSEVRVQQRVVAYLLGSDHVASELREFASVVVPDASLAALQVSDATRVSLQGIRDSLADAEATIFAFLGPDERMASAAVEGVCVDRPLLRISTKHISPAELNITISRIAREARLQKAVIHFTGLDDVRRAQRNSPTDPTNQASPKLLEQFLLAADELLGHVFLTGDVPVTSVLQPGIKRHAFTAVEFPVPDRQQREAIWQDVTDLPPTVTPAALASALQLTRGQIEDAVETARSLAEDELTREAILDGCRIQAQHTLDELGQEVSPAYDWDDIVLPPDRLEQLREVAAQIRHRGTVYEEWGFEDRFSLGNGINLLFTGPSGTGKTMAAEIIANDVGLSLYKLDLSSILSKYIGETEKNLGRVFDQAEGSNAILFFDEADALFGKRTEISDSHDRYANVEVDYLLQRMEEHDGCVIMASNLKENIDDAFRRRINASVEFPMPDEAARRRIWGLIFPEQTPVSELDIEFLAGFDLTGGSIKNVALTASFMAAEDGEAVGMGHLVRALRREFQKTGKLYDADSFGKYQEEFS